MEYKIEKLIRHGLNDPVLSMIFYHPPKAEKITNIYNIANIGWGIKTLKDNLFSSYPGIKNISLLYKHKSTESEINVRISPPPPPLFCLKTLPLGERGNVGYNMAKLTLLLATFLVNIDTIIGSS